MKRALAGRIGRRHNRRGGIGVFVGSMSGEGVRNEKREIKGKKEVKSRKVEGLEGRSK